MKTSGSLEVISGSLITVDAQLTAGGVSDDLSGVKVVLVGRFEERQVVDVEGPGVAVGQLAVVRQGRRKSASRGFDVGLWRLI